MSSMAASLSLSFSIDDHHRRRRHHRHHHHVKPHQTIPFSLASPNHRHPLSTLRNSHFLTTKLFFSSSNSANTQTSSSPSFLTDPFKAGKFLTNQEYENLKFLENFTYHHEVKNGSLLVTAMRSEEMDETVNLLSDSFADSMLLPGGYITLLRFLVKQYLVERRSALPNAVTLVGFYREEKEVNLTSENEEEELVLAGTVEVCFNRKGSNASPPTPTPPRDSPYICNMTVKEGLRRRGIGWHLLRASEEVIGCVCGSKEVYLHCRMIDEAPFNMYVKAGYKVVQTDSIFVLLLLQRRKHLMSKELLFLDSPSELAKSGSEEEQSG